MFFSIPLLSYRFELDPEEQIMSVWFMKASLLARFDGSANVDSLFMIDVSHLVNVHL